VDAPTAGDIVPFMDAHHWGTHQTQQSARHYTVSSVRMAEIESPSARGAGDLDTYERSHRAGDTPLVPPAKLT
jgi:hypothetical protein